MTGRVSAKFVHRPSVHALILDCKQAVVDQDRAFNFENYTTLITYIVMCSTNDQEFLSKSFGILIENGSLELRFGQQFQATIALDTEFG